MGLGEGNVHVAVASLARVRGEGGDVASVAVFAGNRSAGCGPPMFVQRKAEGFVREGVIAEVGQGGSRAAVFLMTIAAGDAGGFLDDAAVQLSHIPHLAGDIRMTLEASIRHRGAFPRCGVTGFAFLNLGM